MLYADGQCHLWVCVHPIEIPRPGRPHAHALRDERRRDPLGTAERRAQPPPRHVGRARHPRRGGAARRRPDDRVLRRPGPGRSRTGKSRPDWRSATSAACFEAVGDAPVADLTAITAVACATSAWCRCPMAGTACTTRRLGPTAPTTCAPSTRRRRSDPASTRTSPRSAPPAADVVGEVADELRALGLGRARAGPGCSRCNALQQRDARRPPDLGREETSRPAAPTRSSSWIMRVWKLGSHVGLDVLRRDLDHDVRARRRGSRRCGSTSSRGESTSSLYRSTCTCSRGNSS